MGIMTAKHIQNSHLFVKKDKHITMLAGFSAINKISETNNG
jgi:hypothetical protein